MFSLPGVGQAQSRCWWGEVGAMSPSRLHPSVLGHSPRSGWRRIGVLRARPYLGSRRERTLQAVSADSGAPACAPHGAPQSPTRAARAPQGSRQAPRSTKRPWHSQGRTYAKCSLPSPSPSPSPFPSRPGGRGFSRVRRASSLATRGEGWGRREEFEGRRVGSIKGERGLTWGPKAGRCHPWRMGAQRRKAASWGATDGDPAAASGLGVGGPSPPRRPF